jgi:2-phosphoglycerate kinase
VVKIDAVVFNDDQKYWPTKKVLLIGGVSGAGKTTIARQLGLQSGFPWLQVDDLRLALQWSRVSLPERTKDLYFFLDTPGIWRLPPERLRDGLISIGELLSPAIEIVIENHLTTSAPLILEGDAILPSLFNRPILQNRRRNKYLQTVFLIEPEEENILRNIKERARGIEGLTDEEIKNEARTKWLYGQWLAEEALHFNLPILEPRPWDSLIERILTLLSW